MNTIVQGMTSILELLFKFSSMIGLPYYGVAIIIFTVIIKVLLYPLTWKQMVSMRRITELQPKMQELQKKYGKNKEKLNQKMMELYTKEKVNPYAGCLRFWSNCQFCGLLSDAVSFPYSNDSTIWF